ncbi:ergothioneine biosynthesis protein EgtB [Synechococcus sp. BA-132 BA5]|uniref:ergothioneine biosynthesis protein EgtB n=1 Tax=Synechococcus sp. BA-132 BA5 TaxID=3110252 RepID=UPI002B2014D1|nr:ergothioneine biosynthesis protein EgtB [Synechococcus sp. BA-132 BA5]MEA5417358.1 ergothioneine biosynthesis protein EgtB [Synechococcus sp. BA-132 BA5]
MGSRAHTPADITRLLQRLQAVRQHSERLIDGLEPEDLCLQGMADASPAKWHLGHTTWFFETFLLEPHLPGHETPDRRWGHLFNSYYEAIGSRHPRPQRGLLTRPAIGEVLAWRRRVDAGLEALLLELERRPAEAAAPLLELVELGLQHEQQHQELLLMDLLDGFSRNPLEPAYGQEPSGAEASEAPAGWRSHPGGLVAIGHDGVGFHFDNEAPRHRQWLEPFSLAETLVTNEAYAAFIADGGYRRSELWMSEGWAVVQERSWCAPRYWRGDWEFSLAGRRPRHPKAPVRHLSWFEADAFARWSGARLPSEAEWELVVTDAAQPGGRPLPQAFGALWQWTATPYRPYPGFRPAAGAVGEYNGKFMTSQFVLRGSSFLTPAGHARATYRNFFAPHCRWMAAGLRLARDGADGGAGGGAMGPC